MANTRKTTTKAVAEKPAVKEPEVKAKREYEPDEDIKCVSVTAGELLMIGKKTGLLYKWSNYGDTAYVEYQDLKAEAYNSKSNYIYLPLIMIEDDELLNTREFAKVAETYKGMLTIDDLDSFFELSNQQFTQQLKKLPTGLKNTVKSVAVSKINDGSLDSIQKIKILDEVLGTELYDLLGNG